jgi:hypothetical protein
LLDKQRRQDGKMRLTRVSAMAFLGKTNLDGFAGGEPSDSAILPEIAAD